MTQTPFYFSFMAITCHAFAHLFDLDQIVSTFLKQYIFFQNFSLRYAITLFHLVVRIDYQLTITAKVRFTIIHVCSQIRDKSRIPALLLGHSKFQSLYTSSLIL